jgi:hypothetical protein
MSPQFRSNLSYALKNCAGRPSRPPDYETESRALVTLAQVLADSPRTVLQTLAETLLKVCRAGSAGISLLTTEDQGKNFYWPAIAGSWKAHIGGGTPRDFGPCGDVLDRNATLLFTHVERRYTYFQPVTPLVEEALLVPFYVGAKAVGTIWAVAHDDQRKFDAEDERVMGSLGKFASSAYQILSSLDALKAEAAERQKAEGTSLFAGCNCGLLGRCHHQQESDRHYHKLEQCRGKNLRLHG